MNKKGSFLDLFLFMILAFILIIFIIVITYAGNRAEQELKEILPSALNAEEKGYNVTQIINDTVGKTNMAFMALRWTSFMLIIGLFFSLLITAYFVKTHPIFFVPYLLIVIVAIIVAVPLSNTYEMLMDDPTLGSTFDEFVGTNWIFLHLPVWIAVIGIGAGIVMFINVLRGDPIYYG